jgi:hypothetical protein
MSPEELKEANRLFYIVKGFLIPEDWTEENIKSMVVSYTRRVWYNHETNDTGFEELLNGRHK